MPVELLQTDAARNSAGPLFDYADGSQGSGFAATSNTSFAGVETVLDRD